MATCEPGGVCGPGPRIAASDPAPAYRKYLVDPIKRSLTQKSTLTMYYGKECPFTRRVMPEVQCLQEALNELGPKAPSFALLEVWHDEENRELFVADSKEGQRCGGVPYFYNSKTDEYLCGATTCAQLKNWAGL